MWSGDRDTFVSCENVWESICLMTAARVFSAEWDSWRCRHRGAAGTALYYSVFSQKCQQLTLGVDIVARGHVSTWTSSYTNSGDITQSHSGSLFLALCSVEWMTSQPQTVDQLLKSDKNHKSEFVKKIQKWTWCWFVSDRIRLFKTYFKGTLTHEITLSCIQSPTL